MKRSHKRLVSQILSMLLVIMGILALVFVWSLANLSWAQGELPVPIDALTDDARAWFVALGIMVFAGVKFVQFTVAFLKVRLDIISGPVTPFVSFVLATVYVLFMFQPGVMNLSGFEALPAWQAYAGSILGIWLGASGSKDKDTLDQKKAAEEFAKTQPVLELPTLEPLTPEVSNDPANAA